MKLNKNELLHIKGGAISGALLDSALNMLKAIIDIGISFGRSIKRAITKKSCSL